MGRLKGILIALTLSGCAAGAITAVPGVLVEGAVNFFRSQEESLAIDMKTALASVQYGLHKMDLDINVLEPVDDGYAITFGNRKLDGLLTLKRQTARLTTLSITVRRGVMRQRSVETAILKAIHAVAERSSRPRRVSLRGFRNIRARPSLKARRIGWYRPGALLAVEKSRRKDWLRIKMPSGRWGYLKKPRRMKRAALLFSEAQHAKIKRLGVNDGAGSNIVG